MRILGYPLGWIMYGIYTICKSYGLSLIIFALLTKMILLPLTAKSQRNGAKMRALAPKMEKLRKSFSNNPQRLQEEQTKLQLEEGANPMAGCLPALIQFPILFGIVDVVYKPLTHILRFNKQMLNSAVAVLESIPEAANENLSKNYQELAILKYASNPQYKDNFASLGSEFMSKISEFSEHNTFLGIVDLGAQADFHPEVWTAGAIALIIIPILSGLVNLIQTVYMQIYQKKTNPSAINMGSMNFMLYGMSLFYIWFSFKIPSGAAFYWTVSGILGFIQTIAFNQYYTPERCEAVLVKDKEKNKNKKPGFMDKLMQQQQELLAQQNGQATTQGSSASRSNRGELSKSEFNDVNRKALNDARKRMAEKYGDEYTEDSND